MKAKEIVIASNVIGASRNSVILKGSESPIYCTNLLFNKLLIEPETEVRIVTVPAHETMRGSIKETTWIEAFLPTRFIR